MQKKHRSMLLCCVLFLIGFLVSSAPAAGAARKHNIKYPAYMQGIDYGNGPIYVIGHKPPDSDSVCTVIAYANLKRKLGVNAEARIASPITKNGRQPKGRSRRHNQNIYRDTRIKPTN